MCFWVLDYVGSDLLVLTAGCASQGQAGIVACMSGWQDLIRGFANRSIIQLYGTDNCNYGYLFLLVTRLPGQ
jgi:hypothetical protein